MATYTNRSATARAWLLIIPALALGLFLLLALPAQPAAASCGGTTTVSNETDLNTAIAAFNAVTTSPCVFTIQLTGSIALTASTTQINNATAGVNLVIEGGGFTVNGQNSAGVRPFDIAANTTVTMNDITVTGGNANGNGGGILNNGTLTLADSTIAGNVAQSPNNGGGIHNGSGGALAVTRSTLSNNTAGNEGGGISNGGALTVTDSTITGNTALIDGGGVYNNVNTPVVITGSAIAGNTATIRDGGGVFNTGNAMTIRNSTLSGNGAGGSGGGICGDSGLSLDSVTITGNTNSALYNADYTAARVTIQNSILANSTGTDCVNGSLGTVTVANPNLVETQNNCGSFTLSSDPQLGPLQNNGGPTQTHALLVGSPAINAGATSLTTDQRNYVRPAGAADDIGAYEYDAVLAITLAGFEAQAQAGHVLVTWQTVSEMNNAGFNLYRTTSEQAPTASDLLAFVPSQGPGSTQGFAYSYQDNAVTAGETYWYWLEDVSLSGATTLHGPVSVVFTAPTAVTLSGLEAAGGGSTDWPWLLALPAAVLAASVMVWRRRNAAV